jgi:hypothetical protein
MVPLESLGEQMIQMLLVLSILLFCWSVYQSGKIPEHKEEDYLEDKKEKDKATKVIAQLIEESDDNYDEDPPTIVMPRK